MLVPVRVPSPRFARLLLALSIICGGTQPVCFAQAKDDDEPYLPGLVVKYQDGQGKTAARIDHLLAFQWGQNVPDPRLQGQDFQATWRGHVLTGARGEFRFALFGTGEMELKIAEQVVIPRQVLQNEWRESKAVTLPADYVPLELSFRRVGKDARLLLAWTGPQFGLEPIPARFLLHQRERSPGNDFERGRLLARALRCDHCHAGETSSKAAPALDHLGGNLARSWLTTWLVVEAKSDQAASPRRMPAFGFAPQQAEAIADWLLSSPAAESVKAPAEKPAKPASGKSKADAKYGERLFVTLGCLACHSWGDQGASGWFGGGDLTQIATKRPQEYFMSWLSEPASLNADHRMPVFSLSLDERTSLALFLAAQKPPGAQPDFKGQGAEARLAEGKNLVEQFHCAACHRLPGHPKDAPVRHAPSSRRLTKQCDWKNGCFAAPARAKHRPGYRLSEGDARALRLYYTSRPEIADNQHDKPDGQLLLTDLNCLACHAREGTRESIPLLVPMLADKLTELAKRTPELATLIPALTPPALNSVGDKLTDQALSDVIVRRGEPHRSYLKVRMPRFALSEGEVQQLVQYFVAADRMPPHSKPLALDKSAQDRFTLAGGRLVSSDGFGCTSCHQVGSVVPSQAPLNARGPDLSQLDRRIRQEWFERWVRNPSRIVPRMEMPSVQIPVGGVLGDKLDDQLAAVWHVLNQPHFEPPPPNPIRTLRQLGSSAVAAPLLITDTVQQGDRVWIKPFLVGLANRHSVMFDLESASLSQWTVGDTARQRTKGKSWYWEMAGAPLLDTGLAQPDLSLQIGARESTAQLRAQFVTEADGWETAGPGLTLRYRLTFKSFTEQGAESKPTTVHVQRRLLPLFAGKDKPVSGFAQELVCDPLPAGAALRLQLLSPKAAAAASLADGGRTLRLGDRFLSRIVLQEPAGIQFSADRTALLLPGGSRQELRVVLEYLSESPIDQFPELPTPPLAARKAEPVEVAPGFTGERLPLPPEIMPTALTWRADGRLIFTSLKGQVYEVAGSDDQLHLLADGLPAPFGACAGPGYVDVSAKYGLLRLYDPGAAGRRVDLIASGWGLSRDYHDWAIGLPRSERGEYYLGIPCQQDKRSVPAAKYHGHVLRLVPRQPTSEDGRLFSVESVSAGHRFPMGFALSRGGELFVTDNQGNYKPFNELNHVRPGAHFGFINTLERGQPAPPRTASAIDIPHPWTRSVNGICFLDTPPELRAQLGRTAFGPCEGHLIGCEYDTRRLVRMTLQQVGDTFQGAAYPLSIPPADPAHGFLGPLVCGVSPRGELVVGSIRDSGWGAGNNVGEIVRVRLDLDKLPCGIAEVRAHHTGFTVQFFRPVRRELATKIDSYVIESYRREPTPAYGGPDRDRRTEKVTEVMLSEDARQVTLKLAELRPGFVYEFRLKNLAENGKEFHPAEAHYTLNAVP